MNISRIALLTVLFSAPIFAMDAPEIQTPTETSTTTTSYFTSAKNLAMAPFVFALATAPDKIAEYSIKPVLDYVASMRYLNYACLTNNTTIISRAIVLAAAAYASYKAYTMYTAEEAVETNEDFFAEDSN